MNKNPILEQLKREALYAQRSLSTELLHQTYGKAKMARQLEALTESEFMEINHMTVYFMNTDKEYIRHQCHLVNIWTKSDVPLTGVHPSCWLQPAILLGLFYLKTLHLKIHFHGNLVFFSRKLRWMG